MTSVDSPGPATPAFPPPADGLPENEPLTPELLEDEAHRNDFMIRWAVVLLAFLLGFTEISETRTLVHVKTGQYLAAHGVLPPRTDVFSYTAEDRPWVNLSWLFDLLLAGVHAAAGAIGLSALKALLAGATFWFLVNSGLPGVSTWWGSVVAGLALLACHWHFAALPEAVTLLGTSILFWTVHRWQHDPSNRSLWLLPPLFLVWANCDPRAYVGLVLLLMYASGETIGSWLGHGTLASGAARRHLGVVAAVCLAATLVNPFGWHAWLSPLSLYRVEYPWLRRLYPVGGSFFELQNHPGTAPALWKSLTHVPIAWAAVAVAAATSLVLNRKRLDWGHTFVFLACLALSVGAAHEMPATAIALGAVAAWNAAAWYRATYRQSYSVSTSEIVFSRGGRVVSVLALVGVALVAISGRLPMSGNARIGAGWLPVLDIALQSLREDVAASFDDRPFNMRPQQGDLLIWLDQKVFVDHRIALYAGEGENDLLTLHDRTRSALRQRNPKDPLAGDRKTWQATTKRFDITHLILPLAANSPDYVFLKEMLLNRDWRLHRLGGVSATFYRIDPANAKLTEWQKEHALNFVVQAFRSPPEDKAKDDKKAPLVMSRDWPASTGAYESLLVKQRTNAPASIREAQHYQSLLEDAASGQLPIPPDVAAAFAHLVIRRAHEGLNENPNVAAGYRMLGVAYFYLGMLESGLARAGGGVSPATRRTQQSTLAFHCSLALQPDQQALQLRLGEIYARNKRYDLAVRHLEKARDLFEAMSAGSEDETDVRRIVDQIDEMLKQPNAMARRVVEEVDKRQTSQQGSVVENARFALLNGCPLKALELVEANPVDFESSYPGRVFRAQLLLEVGRPWAAEEILLNIEREVRDRPGLDFRSFAAVAALVRGDGRRAIDLWNIDLANARFQQFSSLAATLPIVGPPHLWPMLQTQQLVGVFDHHAFLEAETRFQIALSMMEAGESANAAKELRGLMETCPDSPLRPLVRFYLVQVADELIDSEPPSNRIPIEPDMFAKE